jgi:hypothetical protein
VKNFQRKRWREARKQKVKESKKEENREGWWEVERVGSERGGDVSSSVLE